MTKMIGSHIVSRTNSIRSIRDSVKADIPSLAPFVPFL